MDNPGDDYPMRGRGVGPPNMYSNDVRGMPQIDPQLAAALDFEELRLRRQLELQQDIELRRRILEEQQHQQLLSELDYRHQIQQLQQLQAQQQAQAQHHAQHQAHQHQHQQQQQMSLNQLLAQNPHLLEELQHHQQLQHQQQQQHQAQQHAQQQFNLSQRSQLSMGGDGGRGGPGGEEYEFLRRQVMLQQEMQQRFHESQQQQQHRQQQEQQQRQQHHHQQQQQEQLLRSSNSPMLAAMLNASQKGNRLLNAENSLSRNTEKNESLAQQLQHHQQLQQELKQQQQLQQQKIAAEQKQQQQLRNMPPAPAAPTPVQHDQSNKPKHNSTPTHSASSPDKAQMIATPPSAPQASLPTSLVAKVKASVSGDSPMKSSPQDSHMKKRSQSEATNHTEASEDAPLVSMKTKNKRIKSNGKSSKQSPQAKGSPSKSSLATTKKDVSSENNLETDGLNLKASVFEGEEMQSIADNPTEPCKNTLKLNGGDDEETHASASTLAAKPTTSFKKTSNEESCSKKTKKKKSSKEPVDRPASNESDTHATAKSSEMKKKGKTPSKLSSKEETKSTEIKSSPSSSEFKVSKKSNKLPSSKESENALIDSSNVADPLTDHEKSLIRHLMVHEDINISEQLDDSSKKSKSNEIREGSPSLTSSKQPRKNKKRLHADTSITTDKKSKKGDDARDDQAADVLLKFKFMNVTAQEAEDARMWNDLVLPKYVKYIVPDESPMLTDTLMFNLPSLPIEPEHSYFESVIHLENQLLSNLSEAGGNPNEPQLHTKSSTTWPISLSKPRKVYAPKKNDHDKWWPTHTAIRRERRMRDQPSDLEDTDEEIDEDSSPSFAKASVEDMKKRMATTAEPGVLEKIPHCRLYEEYCAKKYGSESMPEPKFCCQVAEHFLNDIMVCCSICSTWRHAQCGGHYKHYSPNSVDPSDLLFEPICDQCFMEQSILKEHENPAVSKRLDRQRIEHLRKTNATNAVMRQAAFAKHSGQYKWPLGSVTASHITGHTRSVQGRHDKAEKQWGEMASRLNGEVAFRPKEKVKVRTRELEKLLVSVEDAEGVTDRHNMILFLERDTSKPQPAGFEGFRRNIFDPDEDHIAASPTSDANKHPINAENGDKNKSNTAAVVSPVTELSVPKDENGKTTTAIEIDSFVPKNGSSSELKKRTSKKKESKPQCNQTSAKGISLCARRGCKKLPRFDSIFCSDACGVSELEFDLLRSLQYASEAHPSVLRS